MLPRVAVVGYEWTAQGLVPDLVNNVDMTMVQIMNKKTLRTMDQLGLSLPIVNRLGMEDVVSSLSRHYQFLQQLS